MKPSVALKGKRDQVRRVVETYGFVSPKLFGSTARDEDREGSDLDLLATIPDALVGKISLFDIADLEAELSELLGVAVDFNIANNMPDHLKAVVSAEAIDL
ncbi:MULTISPECIES: nucleotidyltransferase family protein [Pseudomonas]|uniref:nucleotidyltransferase family protein n=1 Tax=Pseudomonas TaxID=286 RepID=UPI000CE5DDC1|nr:MULTISPECIES: nucleotidyltransferase domain-containing protein [Pseudomonas]AVD91492.1 DNA polymerase III subunit beta [Pseudomonas sp. SWI36]MDD2043687.1 nucleotidyltransferase domain-containing protein [Pseudomonas putida]MDH1551734.1 nucleotidyltransferase domain-containing protein [Pseudomonas juntendi]